MPLDPNFTYAPPQCELVVLYEDDDLIVIDKPAGLLSVMGRLPEHQDSAYLRVLARYPAAKVTHRLDMATSGILMFAKHRDAEVAISRMFQARTVEKHYIALVQGQLQGTGQVDVPLIADWDNRPQQKVDFDCGKKALTLYQALDYDAEQAITRVRLQPITGRSHQLRVHMQYLGHPIMGDRIYHPHGLESSLKQMALHACKLSFQHPLTGIPLDLHSDVPF